MAIEIPDLYLVEDAQRNQLVLGPGSKSYVASPYSLCFAWSSDINEN